MTEAEAQEVVAILGDAYRMGQRRLDWYARALAKHPAGIVAEVLEHLVETEKAPPTIAVIGKAVRARLEALGAASPTFQGRSARMELLVTCLVRLEDATVAQRWRDAAFEEVRGCDPPVAQAEWREARQIANDRHTECNKALRAEGKPLRPARGPILFYEPPGPPDPQPVLSQRAHLVGIRALLTRYERQMPSALLAEHVVAALRSAERDAMAEPGPEWPPDA